MHKSLLVLLHRSELFHTIVGEQLFFGEMWNYCCLSFSLFDIWGMLCMQHVWCRRTERRAS